MERFKPARDNDDLDGRKRRKRHGNAMRAAKPNHNRMAIVGRAPIISKSGHKRMLHEAVLLAAEQVGEDGRGKGQLLGYCRRLAKAYPREFVSLLAKIMPTQITGINGGPLRIITTNMTPDEAAQAYSATLAQIGTLADSAMDGPELLTLNADEYKEAAQ